MNVLLIGSGGREHALAIKIKESPQTENLYILPGNPGTAESGTNISIPFNNFEAIHHLAKEKEIDLVVIGPEAPLVAGMSDFLRSKNIAVFGPDKNAADIEAHKSFSKWLMKKYSVPTAEYMEYDSSEYQKVKRELSKFKYPLVIKADGLAAGKGVIICSSINEAMNAVDDIFKKLIFGDAGKKIIIEEFLTGEEASVFAITDGERFVCLPPAQDHKRIGNNDTGKNTGGMGAYAPAAIITPELSERINKEIISPVLAAMDQEGKKFIGCLYAGLMITAEGPKVIEFNCRFGDPETQVVLPLLQGDFLGLLYSAATGNLNPDLVSYNGGSSVCVIAASEGYPDIFDKGFEIDGLNKSFKDTIIYHAGTKEVKGKIVTNGGRVLGVTSFIPENNIKKAKLQAYTSICKISFKNMYYRTDIADKAIR